MKIDKSHSTNDTTAANYVEGNVNGSKLAGHDITTAGEDAVSGDKIINITEVHHHHHYGEDTKPDVDVSKWKKYFARMLFAAAAAIVIFLLSPKLKTILNNFNRLPVFVGTLVTPATEPVTPTPTTGAVTTPAGDTVAVTDTDATSVTSEKLSFEPAMIAITGGCFQMGSPKTEEERNNDEKQHEVCVKDFQIGKYEVTQAQWQAVMNTNPSEIKGDNLPVENVSWNEVQTFIEKLNVKTDKNYRLPTEAEWEYVARAGTNTPFYTGNCINTNQANYDGTVDYNNCGAKTGKYKKTTVAVGSYPANPWGLYNMAGNVWEWTCSAYVENYDGSEIQCSNNSNAPRAIRGGSWLNDPVALRSAMRNGHYREQDFSLLGFRVASE